MNAKNKAEELYAKFRGMAISVVKEIIEENKLSPTLKDRLHYWQEIEHEINKLKQK